MNTVLIEYLYSTDASVHIRDQWISDKIFSPAASAV